MLKKILVPIDGSAKANAAVEYAIGLARLAGAEITLCHVIPSFPYGDQLGGAYQQVIHNELQAKGEELVNKILDIFSPSGVGLSTKIVWGNPALQICAECKEGQYDLIIMGRRGLDENMDYIMGSVSNRVVRHASCPVLIVR